MRSSPDVRLKRGDGNVVKHRTLQWMPGINHVLLLEIGEIALGL